MASLTMVGPSYFHENVLTYEKQFAEAVNCRSLTENIGGGTIPLLQGWLSGGMSIGSAAAFMITGPATKPTNLGAVKIVLGARRFILYLLFAVIFAFATGIILDLILHISV